MHTPSEYSAFLGNLPEINDLHAALSALRSAEPVAWCESRQCWVVTSYQLVQSALEDPRLSNCRTEIMIRSQVGEGRAFLAADFERIVSGMMIMHDGSSHHRLRSLGNRGLTPYVLERVRMKVAGIADELLDACLKKRNFDLVADFSQPYPARVIAALFDLPEQDRDMFQEPSEAIARFFGATIRDPEVDAVAANQAAVKLEDFFRGLLRERKKHPTDDLLCLFLRGQDESRLTDSEVCAQCIVLLAGGHVTTKNQIANAVHALLSVPDVYRQLCTSPELAEKAVEETLRFDSSVPFVFRLATERLQLGCREIFAGDMVLLALTAANRDPDVFEDPNRLNLNRSAKPRHLTFGVGPHYCLGAGLARMELSVALKGISQRMPGLHFDSLRMPVPVCDSLVFRGFESLPLEC